MARWKQTGVTLPAIGRWTDQDLRRWWGFKGGAPPAKERRDIQAQIEWRTQIPAPMAALDGRAVGD